jgi:Nuclease-related domain
VDELEVKPWRRPGQDRLYVNRAGTRESVAWYDRETGRLEVRDEAYRDRALAALTPFLARPAVAVPQDLGEYDLARNKPGSALGGKIAEEEPNLWLRLLDMLLRRPPSSWAVGQQGERITGARLNRLRGKGWCVLHSVPLASGSDIDHVLIGPPGVFTVNTKHHRGARIWVGDRMVMVNRTRQPGYVPASLHEAERTGRLLTRLCGFPVSARPVLAFVGADRIAVKAVDSSVLITEGESADRILSALPPVLTAAEITAISAVARDRRAWRSA